MHLIAALLTVPSQERDGSKVVSPKLAKEETMRVLIEFVRAGARAAPTLLVFEDAHWADPTTRDLLERFVEHLHDIPALFVITARPEFSSPFTSHPPSPRSIWQNSLRRKAACWSQMSLVGRHCRWPRRSDHCPD